MTRKWDVNMGRLRNFLRNLNYLTKHSLWDQREEDIVYLTNKILDDVQYEYKIFNAGTKKPHILDEEESLDMILSSKKSFVRTGDGEIKIMMGLDQPFQEYDAELADGLKRLLHGDNENLLVGINRNYYIPGYERNYSPFYRRFAYDYRKYYETVLNLNVTYIDSTCTGYSFGEHDNPVVISRYKRWKNAFRDKDIVLISGNGVLEKLENDVFELAKSKTFIPAPAINAWKEHDRIMSDITQSVSKESILVFILGMAGKVMSLELTELGYTCWDVGHLAKYYDAFMKGMAGTDENRQKFYAPD